MVGIFVRHGVIVHL